MLFLGEASNYSKKAVFSHLFAFGLDEDATNLRNFLTIHYGATTDHVALTNSGRSALSLVISALVPQKSKIVINAFTCKAVLDALKSANCTPVYADISEKDLNYTPETLEKIVKNDPKIKGFILQNTLGNPVEIEKFQKIAKTYNLKIIEDLAHCAGRFYPNGREIGTVGDAAALSFGKGKAIDTITGGAAILKNPLLPPLKTPTRRPKFSDSLRARWYPFFGLIARGLEKIHLEKIFLGILLKIHWIERSADLELNLSVRPTYWQSKLALKQLKNLGNEHRAPIRDFKLVKNRDDLLKKLKKAGFDFNETWYDVPISPARYYKTLNFPEKNFPIAKRVSEEIINLPTNYEKSALKPALKIIKEYEK